MALPATYDTAVAAERSLMVDALQPIATTAKSPDAVNAVPGAPLVGGRINNPGPKRQPGQRTLAVFDKKANMTFAGSTNTTNAAADTSDVANSDSPYGTTTLRLAPRNGADTKLAPSVALTTPVNVSGGGYIRLFFKPIANLNVPGGNLSRFSMELHSAGTPASPTANYHKTHEGGGDLLALTTSQSGVGRWQSVGRAIGEMTAVGTGADLSAISFARLWVSSSTSPVATLEVSHIEYVPNPLPKAACIISFDDAFLVEYPRTLMAKYGFPGVVFPSPVAHLNGVGGSGKLSVDQLIMLQDVHGWQVASQGYIDEDLTRHLALGDDGVTAEFAKLRNYQNALGLSGGGHGSYYSGVSADVIALFPALRRHYRSIRRFDSPLGGGMPLDVTEMYPWRDPYNIRCCNAAGFSNNTTTDWTNRFKLLFDAAIAVKGVVYLAAHNDFASASNARTNFETALAYLDANRATIEVVTEEYLHRTYG